jgi:hypothetical protein
MGRRAGPAARPALGSPRIPPPPWELELGNRGGRGNRVRAGKMTRRHTLAPVAAREDPMGFWGTDERAYSASMKTGRECSSVVSLRCWAGPGLECASGSDT